MRTTRRAVLLLAATVVSITVMGGTAVAAPAGDATTDTVMHLAIPEIGLYDVPVQRGFSEAAMAGGVSRVPGTGFPWLSGSDPYIAGHRLGYAGTPSDHVFWNLPSLSRGDMVYLTGPAGKVYTYRVTEIREASPGDVRMMAPTRGREVLSLQTCIEGYGDYWTAGPNWLARYIVRAERVA